MKIRPRRLRSNPMIREFVAESNLKCSDLVCPLFVTMGQNVKEEIASMPGQYRFSLDLIQREIAELKDLGISTFSLFPVIPEDLKDKTGSYSYSKDNYYLNAINEIKTKHQDILLMTDVALDPYSSDGHDGIVSSDGKILNDETLEILGLMSVAQAEAGSDIIGPSDMMDSRIGYIRSQLEGKGFKDTLILSYAAKYASSFYGPFRDALDSAPKSGDKKTYQMDYRNSKEAIKEGLLDEREGADIVMVKPGIAYLDIIRDLSRKLHIPVAVYQVSGEYAMIKAAGIKGWIDETQVMLESLSAFKRAGAQMILSYFAKDFARLK